MTTTLMWLAITAAVAFCLLYRNELVYRCYLEYYLVVEQQKDVDEYNRLAAELETLMRPPVIWHLAMILSFWRSNWDDKVPNVSAKTLRVMLRKGL